MFSLTNPTSFARRSGRRARLATCGQSLAIVALVASAGLQASPAQAQSEDTKVVVRLAAADQHANSPEATHQLLARLERAALEACGASEFSAPDVKLATKRSQCWRDSVAGAIAQIGDPVLSQARSRELESGR